MIHASKRERERERERETNYCASQVDKGPDNEEFNKQLICTNRFFENSGAKSFVPLRNGS